MLIDIRYEMVGITGSSLKYTYQPRILSDLEYKIEQIKPTGESTRSVYNRHGVRFIVKQSGLLGEADPQATLLTLVTGLALLAVATTLVDGLMQYALKDRKAYQSFKTQETPDFGEIRELSDPEREAYVESLREGYAVEINQKHAVNPSNEKQGSAAEPLLAGDARAGNAYE